MKRYGNKLNAVGSPSRSRSSTKELRCNNLILFYSSYLVLEKNVVYNIFFSILLLVSPDEAMCSPDFSTRLVDTIVNDGQPLELSCKVTGDPEPQITWLKNGKVSNINYIKFLYIFC